MANLGVPPASGEFTPMEDDMYEAYTLDVEEVPNSFYNPEVDKPNKATQFRWTLVVRDGEYKGRKMTCLARGRRSGVAGGHSTGR